MNGVLCRITTVISVFFLLTACSTGHHGSFVPSTYIARVNDLELEQIGRVMGQSCQTKALYIFPIGSPPSTDEAVQSAKNQNEDTKFLTDISIDDKVNWEIGYSEQCITVEGMAYR